ncbi:centrosome-associated protein CEP250 [Trichomycterus rosablanca]|uniref:centrosome-associated protein CEP250 n=1 Tax=Trichomycterus rosablanca TaxID=2290929 RepID=UPI002F359B4A
MAEWSKNNRHTTHRDDWEWDFGLGTQDIWKSFRSTSPISFSEFDLLEKSLFKPRSSALSVGLLGSGHHSKISTSSIGSQRKMKQSELSGSQRWQSVSRLAPEGASQAQSSQELELQAALKESSIQRTELVQKLRETHGHLDAQTDLLKTKESQLQQCQSTTQLLELRHKQLKKTLNALEQQKKAADLSCVEESSHLAELQDKVLQLEMDILKTKSSMESRRTAQASASLPDRQLNNSMPMTKDNLNREKTAEKEIKKLKEALRESTEKAKLLDAEKDHALKQLNTSKESQWKILNQMEELKQRLSMSKQAKNELQDQLSETHSQFGQLELEKDLLSTKALRLEDNIEDLKAKLSSALSDKDRLLQEKAELHQKLKSLELQLQRAQLGKEGFTQQVCELHSDLAQAKSLASQHQQSAILMKEKLHSVKQVNENLSTELATVTERLQLTLQQLHELEAEKLIHTNQITALEAERLQLISEKEELKDVFDPGDQEEIRKLKVQCCQLRKFQESLEVEKKELEAHCHGLEKKVQNVEAEYGLKEQELNRVKDKMEQEKEELRKVAAHWNERWLDVAMTLQSTQTQLEEAKKHQQDSSALREEAAGMASKVQALETDVKDSQHLIHSLLDEKKHLETELARIKAGTLEQLELDACRQHLDVEQNESQTSQQRMMENPASLEDVNAELVQLKAELQNVWDMLKSRDTELEVQQQELQSALDQVTQQSSEVQRLEQQLAKKNQELKERDLALKDLMRQGGTVKKQTQEKIPALKNELSGNKDLDTDEKLNSFKNMQLNETKRTAEEQRQDTEDLQNSLSRKPSQKIKEERKSPTLNRKEKSDLIDPNQQRRLITEQLKTLFKEREQTGQVLDQSSKSLKINKLQEQGEHAVAQESQELNCSTTNSH